MGAIGTSFALSETKRMAMNSLPQGELLWAIGKSVGSDIITGMSDLLKEGLLAQGRALLGPTLSSLVMNGGHFNNDNQSKMIELLSNPAVIAELIKNANREQTFALADAYERGDVEAIGRMYGQILTMLPVGGPAVVGNVSKVSKLAKLEQLANKAADLQKVEKAAEAAQAAKVANKADDLILPGMDRPVRPVNPAHPPNPAVVEAMGSSRVQGMSACKSADCSEIAEKLLDAAGGKGKIIEVRPSKPGNLVLYENGVKEPGMAYHQVYTDGRYVYDPRLSSNPIPKGDWEMHIKGINPNGIFISEKLKGL